MNRNTDEQDLRIARNRCCYYTAQGSSIVAWTLSPQWTMVGDREKTRGTVYIAGSTRALHTEVCSGEIKAYTRDHHEAFSYSDAFIAEVG